MEIKKYGLTDKEIQTLKSAGIAEETINDLAIERLADQIMESDIPERDDIREELFIMFPDLPDPVANFLTEVILKHPEEGEKAAKGIDDYLKSHAEELPDGFDKPSAIIPDKRSVGLYWAKKALGEKPEPDPYWYGGKILAFIMTNILTDENVRNAVLDVKATSPVY